MELSGSDLAFLITTGTGALVAIIVAIQKSKCSSINCGWGCIRCIRSSDFNQNNKEEKEEKNNLDIV